MQEDHPMRNSMIVAPLFAVILTAAQPPIEGKTGLKVGEKAPAFKLKDQDGKERTLEEFTKKGTVALVFHRSAEW
jgi:hypothetical protein